MNIGMAFQVNAKGQGCDLVLPIAFSNFGPCTSSVSIIWEFVRIHILEPHPSPTGSEIQVILLQTEV